jgi:hypothetical protein
MEFQDKYIIFLDIEFQNFNIKSKQYHYILELGIIIFEKGKEIPILIEHVNFPILDFPNMRLIGVEYSSVSEETEIKMIKNQDKLIISADLEDIKKKQKLINYIPNKMVKIYLKDAILNNDSKRIDENKELIEKQAKKAMYTYFYYHMPKDYKKVFENQIELYKSDKLVKERLVNPKEYLVKLNKYLKNGLLVHKEGTDLEALRNDFNHYKIKSEVEAKKCFDIAVYNKYFEKLNSASLHKSYLYLYENKINNEKEKDKDLLKYHNKILDLVNLKMDKFKAHNPLVDSFMTIFVFLLMKK